MPRPCSICAHSHRLEMERALDAGRPLRTVAKTYGVDFRTLHRHRKGGHSGQPAPVYTSRPAAQPALRPARTRTPAASSSARSTASAVPPIPSSPGAVLDGVELDVRTRLAAAVDAGDDRVIGQLVKALLDILDKKQRLSPVAAGGAVDLTRTSQYLRLRAALRTALRPFPEAAVAVAAALDALEGE